MGNATPSAAEQTIATLVGSILVSQPCQKINFCYAKSDSYVDGSGYFYIALSLASPDNKANAVGVSIKSMPPGTAAQYNPTTNNFEFPLAGYGATPFQKMTIVHEATHAVLDSRAPSQVTRTVDNETIAYIAGAFYNIYSAGSSGGPFPYSPPSAGIFAEAHKIALRLYKIQEKWSNGFRLLINPWDVTALQTAIRAASIYNYMNTNPTGTYGDDGVPL